MKKVIDYLRIHGLAILISVGATLGVIYMMNTSESVPAHCQTPTPKHPTQPQ